MEVINLSEGTTQKIEIPKANPDEIDLSGYTETPPVQTPPVALPPPGGPTAPQGVSQFDPRYYYVRGKKKGQLKPLSQIKYQTPVTPATMPGNAVLTGALLITLVDLIIPLAISIVNNQLSKDKIDYEKLQMDEKQKKTLEPLCDEVVKYLQIQGNPVILLMVAAIGIYGVNFAAQKLLNKKK